MKTLQLWNTEIFSARYASVEREIVRILRPDLFEPMRSIIKRKEFKELLEPL